MNEQLQGAAVQILERAISGIDQSVEFMQAELPEVVEQLLLWYAVKGVAFSIIGVLVFICGIFILVKLTKSKPPAIENINQSFLWEASILDRNEIDRNFFSFTLLGCSGLAMVCVGFIRFASSLLEVIQIWIAPKIWLMEYASRLVS